MTRRLCAENPQHGYMRPRHGIVAWRGSDLQKCDICGYYEKAGSQHDKGLFKPGSREVLVTQALLGLRW